MAKKKPESNEPVISNIPIPASENPMVIDLPDGQKIVVGKLNPGSVIEVATWRGTGRPDSRTNRFMLGVSESSNSPAPAAVSQPSTPVKRKFTFSRGREKTTPTVERKETTNFISRLVGGTIISLSKALKRTQELTPVETTTDLEINAWIANLSREIQEESRLVVQPKRATKKTSAKNTRAKNAMAQGKGKDK